METNIFFIIVVYNKKCVDSLTIQRLSEYNQKNIYIVDNSENDYGNLDFAQRNNYFYINMGGNKGLSKAYNKAIEQIRCEENDIIMLLDDDTDITHEYIKGLVQSVKKNLDVDIFFPIIKNYNELIISPTIFTKIKLFNVKCEKETFYIKNSQICAINSCLAVRKKIFNIYKYDENLFLDYIDNDFFAFVRSKLIKCKVVDNVVYQNLFNSSNPPLEKKYNRMKIEIRDYKIYLFKRTWIERIFGFIRIKYWIIRECIKYKDLIFLRLIRKEKNEKN